MTSVAQDVENSFHEVECSICLDELQAGQRVTRVQCQHEFHTDCIFNWIAAKLAKDNPANCPNCNHTIIPPIKKLPPRGGHAFPTTPIGSPLTRSTEFVAAATAQMAARNMFMGQRPSARFMAITFLVLILFCGIASYLVIEFGSQHGKQ
mmetsp:Transcript_29766/g.60102  ORF Transcript_29766/g.60102 Transcript_29766/m.60102 type:complete len:150 (+) Transcript_29766:310-759(+)